MAGDVADLSALADEVSASPPSRHELHVKHEKHLAHLDHTAHQAHQEHQRHLAHVEAVKRQAHRDHLRHVKHTRHLKHEAHVMNTTVPEPIVLTAQQRNDWVAIRDEVLANRKRISK